MPRRILVLFFCSWFVSCSRREEAPAPPKASVTIAPPPAPRVLYLPDGDVPGAAVSSLAPTEGAPVAIPFGRCPPDMVDVRGEYCIDRFEAGLADVLTGKKLSPYYHPKAGQTRATFTKWQKERSEMGPAAARALPVPAPPEFQISGPFEPKAVSERGAVPNGYLNRDSAELACRNAGKRLCTSEEWVIACRGQQGRKFPYGNEYAAGACNVHRDTHPARALHDDASIGHLDPRLNQVEGSDGPLLRPTGDTAACRSEWGADAVYDMVGNLDEWIDDPNGTFVGGFYSRATVEGCDARIESHAAEYFDYSLGVRCCFTPGRRLQGL